MAQDLLLGIGGVRSEQGRYTRGGRRQRQPVRAGFAASLAKPGKNFTGVTKGWNC